MDRPKEHHDLKPRFKHRPKQAGWQEQSFLRPARVRAGALPNWRGQLSRPLIGSKHRPPVGAGIRC